ncbi:ATP-binding protein [Hydrogenophaga sp. PAMC20947]|uniref:sensor histidine kinase n=1 Tax=Hydrogenophaga sp. PAMC20947 TaxID=2565558 RepID=UPI001446B773|nr:ATP-binding protein [Hydrogenophaga sp. PAMC20947]
MRWPAYLWAGWLVLLLLVVLGWSTGVGTVSGADKVVRADLVVLQGSDPDAQAYAQAQPVDLPHIMQEPRRDFSGRARYTMDWPAAALNAPGSSKPLGILLSRAGPRFRVLVNGVEVGNEGWYRGGGYFDAGIQSHLVLVPAALLSDRAGVNVVQVDVQGQRLRISGLGPVWIGDADALSERVRWLTWWQVHLTWMVMASAGLMGLLTLVIWIQTGERLFGLLAGGLLFLAIRLTLSAPVFLPGPFAAWDFVHKLSFAWYCGFLYLFMSALFHFHLSIVRKVVEAMMVVAPLWLLVLAWSGNYQLYRAWNGVILLVCLMSLSMVIHRARWGWDVNQRLMVVVGLATMVTGLRDFLVVQMGWPGDADLRWMTPGSFVLMFAMGAVLVRRTGALMGESVRLNAELSTRVEERSQELRVVFDRLRQVEARRVLDEERQRLMRDMHDGLGSHLVQTLNMVHHSGDGVSSIAVANMLTHALDELRLTLSSLEPMDGDLATALGVLRARVAPALEAAGIELVWAVADVPKVPALEAGSVMHLFRCLQEVFANVVKHAQASRVTVRTWEEGGRVRLSVADDGVGMGFPDSAPPGCVPSQGRGMGNLQARAQAIGADLQVTSSNQGTVVSLVFGKNTKA